MKYHYKSGQNKKILKIPSVDKDADQLGLSYIAGGVQDAMAILEKSLAVLNVHILYDPQISLLGIN